MQKLMPLALQPTGFVHPNSQLYKAKVAFVILIPNDVLSVLHIAPPAPAVAADQACTCEGPCPLIGMLLKSIMQHLELCNCEWRRLPGLTEVHSGAYAFAPTTKT